jgi:structural maintenance of chromosomes protein 5
VDTVKVVEWLENQGGQARFQRQIFLPPLLSLGIKNKAFAAIVDNCFRKEDLSVFTCQTRDDFKEFSRLVIDNNENIFSKRMNIRAVENSQGNQFKDWVAPIPNDQLKALGFECWLKDLISGPDEVMNTLCHQNQIHATVYP